MLAIRMQRTGHKGHATFRVVVQDSRRTPTSGKFVALLGSYDPHTKTTTLKKDKAEVYLKNGAQPSDRVAALLKKEGIKLPSWVKLTPPKQSKIRNLEKLRRNRPVVPVEVAATIEPEAPIEATTEEVPAPEESQEE
jgi:small subunit ribosomal protein S16